MIWFVDTMNFSTILYSLLVILFDLRFYSNRLTFLDMWQEVWRSIAVRLRYKKVAAKHNKYMKIWSRRHILMLFSVCDTQKSIWKKCLFFPFLQILSIGKKKQSIMSSMLFFPLFSSLPLVHYLVALKQPSEWIDLMNEAP